MFKIPFVVTQVAQSLEFEGSLVLTLHSDPVEPHDYRFTIHRDRPITIFVPDNQENRTVFALGERLSADFTSVEHHDQKAA